MIKIVARRVWVCGMQLQQPCAEASHCDDRVCWNKKVSRLSELASRCFMIQSGVVEKVTPSFVMNQDPVQMKALGNPMVYLRKVYSFDWYALHRRRWHAEETWFAQPLDTSSGVFSYFIDNQSARICAFFEKPALSEAGQEITAGELVVDFTYRRTTRKPGSKCLVKLKRNDPPLPSLSHLR